MEARKRVLVKISDYELPASSAGEDVTLRRFAAIFSREVDFKFTGHSAALDGLEAFQLENRFAPIKGPKALRKITGLFLTPLNLFLAVRKHKPDLLMCIGGVYFNGLAVLIVGRLTRTKVLVRTAEDHYRVAKLQEDWRDKLKHKIIFKPISHFVLKHSDYTMTVGRQSSRYLGRILKRPVLFAMSPIDSPKQVKAVNRAEFKQLLYVGTLNLVKGSDRLYKVVSGVLSQSYDWKFVFVGTDKSKTHRPVEELKQKFPEQIEIRKPIPNNQLADVYQQASALLFTTQVGIGYGLVSLEALQNGCPVVAVDPKLDVRFFHKKRAFTVDGAIAHILKNEPISTEMDAQNDAEIEQAHLNLLRGIFAKGG
jgi:glycosyltransferase involved in cell wall biosynthesis